MSEMQMNETIHRFSESMKKAASRARELAIVQKNPKWNEVAKGLDGLAHTARGMYESSPLTRQETLAAADLVAGKQTEH